VRAQVTTVPIRLRGVWTGMLAVAMTLNDIASWFDQHHVSLTAALAPLGPRGHRRDAELSN
jgi:hypothetical protein